MEEDRIITKIFDADGKGWSGRAGEPVPSALIRQGVARLPVVAGVFLALLALGWVVPQVAEGDFLEEFERFYNWGPPVAAIVASIGIILLVRYSRITPSRLVDIGLVYQVVVSFAIALAGYWTAFRGVTAQEMNGDRIGITAVSLWMMVFAALVPARPRRMLVALLGSAAATPVVYAASVAVGDAPKLDAGNFFFLMAFPYLVTAGAAYFAARTVYRLGQKVKQAEEMGGYRLEEYIGGGGMGEVWRASHRMLARPAAVKLVRGEAVGPEADSFGTILARFEREAQVTAALESAHTVELYDFGSTEDGTLYYVMELLDGIDLEKLVVRYGALPPERVVHILRQVCESLGEAHRRGLVHRDVKPANVVLCPRAFTYDFVKVLDFGLVKRHSGFEPVDNLSKMGMIVGTPAYLAPEVITGSPADARSDIYALGCVAYWMLTGTQVFETPTVPALLVAHASHEPDRPSARASREIPADLEALVMDCLKKDPDERVQDGEAVSRRLGALQMQRDWSQEDAKAWWESYRESGAV